MVQLRSIFWLNWNAPTGALGPGDSSRQQNKHNYKYYCTGIIQNSPLCYGIPSPLLRHYGFVANRPLIIPGRRYRLLSWWAPRPFVQKTSIWRREKQQLFQELTTSNIVKHCCRRARAVKGMNSKPIEISRAGSSPADDATTCWDHGQRDTLYPWTGQLMNPPNRTPVPFWGHTTQIPRSLSHIVPKTWLQS